jgi:hypothetical protein
MSRPWFGARSGRFVPPALLDQKFWGNDFAGLVFASPLQSVSKPAGCDE